MIMESRFMDSYDHGITIVLVVILYTSDCALDCHRTLIRVMMTLSLRFLLNPDLSRAMVLYSHLLKKVPQPSPRKVQQRRERTFQSYALVFQFGKKRKGGTLIKVEVLEHTRLFKMKCPTLKWRKNSTKRNIKKK